MISGCRGSLCWTELKQRLIPLQQTGRNSAQGFNLTIGSLSILPRHGERQRGKQRPASPNEEQFLGGESGMKLSTVDSRTIDGVNNQIDETTAREIVDE